MRKLMKWMNSDGSWQASTLDLPALDPTVDATLHRWCVVTGGLALVLSRLSPTERSARFACTEALHAVIRRQLQQSQEVSVPADLLGEVMHEIAEVADPLTRTCLRACFQASLRPNAPDARPNQPLSDQRSSRPVSVLQSLPSTSRPSMQSIASTGFAPKLLQERSAELRRKLATARNTGLAELK